MFVVTKAQSILWYWPITDWHLGWPAWWYFILYKMEGINYRCVAHCNISLPRGRIVPILLRFHLKTWKVQNMISVVLISRVASCVTTNHAVELVYIFRKVPITNVSSTGCFILLAAQLLLLLLSVPFPDDVLFFSRLTSAFCCCFQSCGVTVACI